MSKIKYFTKPLLLAATIIGIERNYNRMLSEDFVRSLKGNLRFPVTFSMLHEHIDGESAEPHVRATVVVSETVAVTFDVDLALFNNLPFAEV